MFQRAPASPAGEVRTTTTVLSRESRSEPVILEYESGTLALS